MYCRKTLWMLQTKKKASKKVEKYHIKNREFVRINHIIDILVVIRLENIQKIIHEYKEQLQSQFLNRKITHPLHFRDSVSKTDFPLNLLLFSIEILLNLNEYIYKYYSI